MEPVIGEVALLPYAHFKPPVGWIACDGTLHSAHDPDESVLHELLGGRLREGADHQYRLPDYNQGHPSSTGKPRYCVAANGFWPDPSYSNRPRCIGEVVRFFLHAHFVEGSWQRYDDGLAPALPHTTCLIAKTGERAMPESYSGAIRLVDVNVAGSEHPGWWPCDGRVVKIGSTESRVMLSLIGTTYGGDGFTEIKLPNLTAKQGLRYYICAQGIFPQMPR